MTGFHVLVLAFLLTPSFAAQPPQQGGVQAGVQPTEEQLEQQFQKEMDEMFKNQRPGSEISPDMKDKILERVNGLPESQRQEFLDRYMKLDSLREKMKELRKTDPEAARALFPEMREARQALAEIDPGLMKMIGRAYWNSSEGGGSWRDGPGGPHGKPGPDQMQDARDWARIGRDDDVIQRGVGDVLRAGGDRQGAAEAYQRAISINPRDGKALTGLSQVQADDGNYEAAVETARRALDVDPRNAVAYGMVKMYKDRSSASNEVAGGGQPSGSQFFTPQAPVGDYGRVGGALEVRQTVGKQAPPGLRESLELADTAARLLAVRDSAGAKAAAEKALHLHPENIRALWALYQANAMRKDYPAALKAIETALTIDGANTTLLNAKSNILSRLGRYEEAMGVADVVLSASPGDAAALFNKSFALSGLGRRTEALSYLRQAAQRDSRFMNLYERAAALPPDADLVGLFTGDAPAAKPAAAPSGGGRFRWAAVAGGVLVGLLLIVLGVSQGGTLMTSVTRGLSKLGSASPTVQPMAVGTPAPGPAEGLAASGIRIEKKIGQGGMGVVYMGTDTSLERPVAIKKMREEIRSDMRERDRFIKEAKTVAALRHPNIVEIYSIVEDGSDVYLVFEYVTGKTVHDLTYERGALPAGWAISVIKAVASALDYAHKRGVVHRDLKPSNIMVEDDGMVKVMDFGVARMAKDSLSRMSMTNTVVGTPPYMAPEQEQGIVRRESDVYALAVCLYEMVTGTLPFQGIGAGMLMAKLNGTYVPASRVVQGLPPGFDEVMAQALAPDPEKRLKSAGDFAAALSTLPV